MATVTINAYLIWHSASWMEPPQEWILSWSDMACLGPEYVCAGMREVQVEIPDSFDPKPIQIQNLRAEKNNILAEAQLKVNNIDEQIQRLLCLEPPKPLEPEIVL